MFRKKPKTYTIKIGEPGRESEIIVTNSKLVELCEADPEWAERCLTGYISLALSDITIPPCSRERLRELQSEYHEKMMQFLAMYGLGAKTGPCSDETPN